MKAVTKHVIFSTRLISIILFIILADTSAAQTNKERIAEAVSFYRHDWPNKAYPVLYELRKSKDFSAEAEYSLGSIYQHGEAGEETNYNEAIHWFDEAVDDGNADAYAALGQMHHQGYGFKKSESAAVKLYRKAVEKGSPLGQLYLSYEYADGNNMPVDKTEALRLMTLAADQNYIPAVTALAEIYEAGMLTEKNHAEAIRFFLRAAAIHRDEHYGSGSRASFRLNQMGLSEVTGLLLTDETKLTLAFEFINHGDYGNAFPILDEASHKNTFPAYAAMLLGYMYDMGSGVAQDYKKARSLYEYAAARGDTAAPFDIGILYYTGHGVPVDYTMAFNWYMKAAKLNHLGAITNVGFQYLYGIGVEKNYAEAITWLRNAADRGYDPAQFDMGMAYREGWGVEKNEATAQNWFRLSAERGNSSAAALYVKPAPVAGSVYQQTNDPAAKKQSVSICSCCNGRGSKSVYMNSTYQKKDQFGALQGIPSHYVNVSCSCCGGSGYR